MELKKIYEVIENFAPLETQDSWDCSGILIEVSKDIKKVMLCLSVTGDIIEQAEKLGFDLIISHHPLFFIPFEFNKGISVYSAHTNLDKADGGTTDTLIDLLGFGKSQKENDFLRVVDLKEEINLFDFVAQVKSALSLDNLKIVNNFNKTTIKKLAFCAGSGADFLGDAQKIRADILITGDIKYHTALDSDIIIFDVGHFESEQPVLKTIYKLIEPLGLEVIIADEKSPFINY